ncbi:MAG: dihydroorotase family protein [Candidatus Gagatemarchaeaceae archaeon]
MEHDLVIQGTVVGPEGLSSLEVGVSKGRISEIRKQGLVGRRRISAGRSLIFPGFIDVHVHMREPGWENKEDFRTGSEAAIHGGVTTVVDMPNNPTPTTTREALDEKRKLAQSKARVDVRFYGGVTSESLGSVETIKDGVVGYKIYLARTTGELTFPSEELGKAFGLIARTRKPVSLHCEDQTVIDGCASKLEGKRRPDVHCDIRPPQAEIESVTKVVEALRGAKGLHANVCHASTSETISLVESARSEGLRLECEAALHHLYFNRKAMLDNPLLKTNPPLRDESDRMSLVEGLRNGKVSFLVTDHAPHSKAEKTSGGMSGVPGLDDYGHIVSWLIRTAGAEPAAIARATSRKPASYSGLTDRGRIEEGLRADFAILDISSPEKVTAEEVRSKCGWSPYEGIEFPGRVRWTIRGGEVLLDDYELVS